MASDIQGEESISVLSGRRDTVSTISERPSGQSTLERGVRESVLLAAACRGRDGGVVEIGKSWVRSRRARAREVKSNGLASAGRRGESSCPGAERIASTGAGESLAGNGGKFVGCGALVHVEGTGLGVACLDTDVPINGDGILRVLDQRNTLRHGIRGC